MDTDTTSDRYRYREIANELRLLIPKIKHAEVAQELRLLAVSYERLAEHLRSRPLLDHPKTRGICRAVDEA